MIARLLSSISPRRLLLYLFLLSFFPLLALILNYSAEKKELAKVEAMLLQTEKGVLIGRQREATNTLVRTLYKGADHFFIDHDLETLTFLKREKDALHRLIHSKTFTGNDSAEERYAFVTGNLNRLFFTEGSLQKGEGIEEVVEHLAHPVEIDSYDLKELLSRIEAGRPGQPQLMITDFKLHKKEVPGGSEVYTLNLQLLKREYEDV